MAKNKDSKMPHYELLFIIPNKYTEDETKDVINHVHKIIEDMGGKKTLDEFWGKKKFCYPINHEMHGYYSLVEFDLEAEKINKLNQELRMSAEVLRHMIVNRAPKTDEQIAAEKRLLEKRIKKSESKKEEPKKTESKKETKTTTSEKVDTKELDDKLNKILETDDLL
ncbi:30S ribosomal protein S6 [Candidatus Parcubacteria bacterium]|mgnify:CR=1 FL=1|nr:MAG: 30S ribosomal protein S6 [Candidatus Parcubacteria bacterium]